MSSRHRGTGWGGLLAVGAVLSGLGPLSPAWAAGPPEFSGARAFEDLKRIAAFGPRPAGSAALARTRQWIEQQLKARGIQVEEDSFAASTPVGELPMVNLIAKFPGARPQVVVIAGHYDTKRFDSFSFVGANDGGSSAAFLMEMARVLAGRTHLLSYQVVFFDGEEATQPQWSESDSVYGSRHLVERLTASGELSRLQAMILVDMIGDAKLDIQRDLNSTPWLRTLVFDTAHRLGYGKYFSNGEMAVEDDHLPFVNAGVSAVDLIDLDYGPGNSYWHTAKDTVEHCSPLSLTIVGRVVTAALAELETSPRTK